MRINKWTMDFEEYKDLPCEVPCTMYGTLLKNGKIDNPFFGMNEQKYMPLSNKSCLFKTTFTVDGDTLSKDYSELNFYGLDTLCNIFLNGKKIAYTSDMHRFYSFDVKDMLVCGENSLEIEFLSPVEYITKMNNKYYIWNNNDTIKGAAHIRKAICMFGWDWAPKLPDMGIFRSVELCSYNTDKIEDIYVRQHHHDGKVELEIFAEGKRGGDVSFRATIDGKTVLLKDGYAEVTIENPKLWWVRGYGEQNLYTLKVEMLKDGSVIDEKVKKIGLRTIEVSTAIDKIGREFCFINNGVRIFAMGANYVPQDSLLSEITTERTKKLLSSCVDANHNCIRVWGGGYFPDDDFFDLCDEMGILVWQDFLTACYPIWLHDEFKENYIEEAIYNIKRLRNHPSLGILCGNNELERNIMANEIFQGELFRQDYIELFERILPSLCEKYAPEIFYWQSTPSSFGGFYDVENENAGDSHFYSPFVDYRNHNFRFCSEYGFQAFPTMKTIKSFAEDKDMNCFSRVMENHQKSAIGNHTILGYIASSYLMPHSFEDFVYASQLYQANAISDAVQHFRSIRGICMGSIYWQLNDCAPVASWSSLDYYGRYKALHYFVRRLYAPVEVGVFIDNETVSVNVSNEKMTPFKGHVEVSLSSNDMTVIEKDSADVEVEALGSKYVFEKTYNLCDKYSEYVCVSLYDENNNLVSQQTKLFVKPKQYSFEKPNISFKLEKVSEDKAEITLCSDIYAMGVYVDFENTDVVFSDNFFDIAEKRDYKICFNSSLSASELISQIKIKSVYDIGRN